MERASPQNLPESTAPWIMFQRWSDLLFAHWSLDPDEVRPLLPRSLELDTFEEKAWIAVTPLRMSGVRLRWLPPIPTASEFPELNLRTYVRSGDSSGVYFFSLDAGSLLAATAARAVLGLPYFWSRMSCRRVGEETFFESRRASHPAAEFRASYRPAGEVFRSAPGSLEHWLTERYALYVVRSGKPRRMRIDHEPWPLQLAEGEIERDTVASAAGLALEGRPLLHFASLLDVRVWPPEILCD